MSKYLLEVRVVGDMMWSERDEIAFHAVFSCLCDFIEKDHGSVERYQEYINFLEGRCRETGRDIDKEEFKSHQVTMELYKWYNGQDWEEVDYLYSHIGEPCPHDKLIQAVSVMGCWWS